MQHKEPTTRPSRRPTVEVLDSSNTLRGEDTSVHDWYRFVLSFPPHLVREYLDRFEIKSGAVLDPFCGTGTTVVEAKKLGFTAIGVEASPMAHFAATVKTNWNVDAEGLVKATNRVAERALAELKADSMVDEECDDNSVNAFRALEPDAESILISNSISPSPLHKVLVLVDAIKRVRDPQYRNIMMLAVAKLLPSEYGNLRFGPEVGVGHLKVDAAVVEPWRKCMKVFSSDLSQLIPGRESTVFRGDARDLPVQLKRNSVGSVFTSPPYPNEKDYTRTTRLESVILGFYQNKMELREFKQSLLRSNTRNIYVGDNDSNSVKFVPSVTKLASEIENRRLDLGKTSGFEKNYHKVVLNYFGGMALHFESLGPKLKPGARLGYVVGDQASFFRILIRTGEILAEIVEPLGYRVESLDLFRTRIATATRDQLREEVLVLQWVGKD